MPCPGFSFLPSQVPLLEERGRAPRAGVGARVLVVGRVVAQLGRRAERLVARGALVGRRRGGGAGGGA